MRSAGTPETVIAWRIIDTPTMGREHFEDPLQILARMAFP
jgi:hypothetical protein